MATFLINVLKVIFLAVIFPVTIAVTLTFKDHFLSYPPHYQEFFFWGTVSFLIIFIFVYQFVPFYDFGQRIMEFLLRFLAPFDKIFTYIIPLFLISTILCFSFVHRFLGVKEYDPYFLFFIGFFLMMHVILTARSIQEKSASPVRPSYLLMINLTYITNILIVVLLMDLVTARFTFPEFFKNVVMESRDIILGVIKKVI